MDEIKRYRVGEVKGSLKISLPRVLAQAVGIRKGDEVVWVITKEGLTLKKIS
ncbi:MAG: SpoVT/AbrB-like, predicted transcription regulator domain protein [Candidatus Syntrophoarchaeum caldarius]|uniref:SpoVT/AbrB-like, predicted transcription regulator domain protein n=1 Tax=Candidatus Syntropharchaeum caldarium TaxID=1838285 RepID=A0A1F2P9P8_9EURY|nr:MAG: SpoVT/AbrB-like, predicted transcription regulator domain protein [Candidatus Syntrophoarchaeum caldarius]